MIQKSFKVQFKYGMHARPCGIILKNIHKFDLKKAVYEYETQSGIVCADMKSVLSMLTASVHCGETISIILEGKDEQKALQFFEEFFSCGEEEFFDKFGEDIS